MGRVIKVSGRELHLILDDSREHRPTPRCPCKPHKSKAIKGDRKIFTHRWKDL